MQQKRFDKVIIGICTLAILCIMMSIGIRFLTKNILIDYLGMNNRFTGIVFYDDADIVKSNIKDEVSATDNINLQEYDYSAETDAIYWQEYYPFEETDINTISSDYILDEPVSFVDRYKKTVLDIESKIKDYTTNFLIFRSNVVDASAKYKEMIGWNLASYDEYNGVVIMPDGYLTSYIAKQDVSTHFLSLAELNNFCENNGCEFLFVSAPYKISEYDDAEISGSLDFSNQNTNDLIGLLKDNDISCFDIRQVIHDEGKNHHSLFYKTDHHWLTTTGIWGAQKILDYCNEHYGWQANSTCLDLSNFRIEEYPNSFLGSKGKKITLERTQPDDFELLFPLFETKIHYRVPAENVDVIGDYAVCYDMDRIGHNDYYNESSYHACNYGDQAINEIENLLYAEDKTIVIIRDSFGDPLISGLALGIKNVYALDLRHFTGSVHSYIKEKNPDLVIVMYNPSVIGKSIDYDTHKDLFDFR